MRFEVRRLGYDLGNKVPGQSTTMLLLIPEGEEESKLLDEVLGSKIPTPVVGGAGLTADLVGEVQLSDGYGQHYVWLENAADHNSKVHK